MELRAPVVWLGMGRGLTVHQRVYPACKQGSRKAENALLSALAGWIPASTRVIVVTDAGFGPPRFKAVALESDWTDTRWQQPAAWRGCMAGRADAGSSRHGASAAVGGLPAECERLDCDLALVRHVPVVRLQYGRPGSKPTPKANAPAQRSAREPWVLAPSKNLRDLRADELVALYARRMQIEENFRDTKSPVFGMGSAIGRSRSALRFQALLLIGTLAACMLWHIGQIAEAEGLHRRFKSTTRKTREISLLTLARLLCERLNTPLSSNGVKSLTRRLGIGTQKRRGNVSPFTRFGYDLEFSNDAQLDDLRMDLNALAEPLNQLNLSAKKHGASIALVIPDPHHVKRLVDTPRGSAIRSLPFMKGRPWVRYDKHCHVDFRIDCGRLHSAR